MKLKTRFGRFAAFDGFDAALDGERVLLTRRGEVFGRMRLKRWRHVALQARVSFERSDARALTLTKFSYVHSLMSNNSSNVDDQLFCVNTRLASLRSTILMQPHVMAGK